MTVKTQNSLMQLAINTDDSVTVDMGKFSFAPEAVPFDFPNKQEQYPLSVNGEELKIAIANIGNPHCLILVDDIDSAPVNTIGPIVESHKKFPERVNVGFMQMINPNEINLRVYERGAGETLACGSGACAAVAMGNHLGLLENRVKAHLLGGDLDIELTKEQHAVMTGPAEFSFTGEIEL